jgi:hypothetical protein
MHSQATDVKDHHGLGEEGTQPDSLSWKTIKRLIHGVE